MITINLPCFSMEGLFLSAMRTFFLWLLCTLAFSKLFAQDPVYRTINNLNGLSSNTVYNILQDKNGYVWMAHDKGVTRYDGISFNSFKTASLQSKSVSNLMVIGDSVYCQDFAGNCYVANIKNQKLNFVFSTPGVYATIGVINTNTLCSIKPDSIRTLTIDSKKYHTTSIRNLTSPAVSFNNGGAYFFYGNSIASFDGRKISTTLKLTKKAENIYHLLKLKNSFYGFTKNVFPYIYAITAEKMLPVGMLLPKGLFIQDISIIENEVWVNTSTGAYCFDFNFKPLYNGKCFFRDASISKVIKDREGSYWFSTLNKGVFQVANINTILYPYKNIGLTAISKIDQNKLLIGTSSNEVLIFDKENNKYQLLYRQPSNHEVLDVFYDSAHSLVAASSYNLLFWNRQKQVSTVSIASKKIIPLYLNDLYAVAYASGIALVKVGGSLQQENIPLWLQRPGSIIEQNVYKIQLNLGRCRSVAYDAKKQILYAATANGISYFSPQGSGFIKNKSDIIYASQLLQRDSILYVGTFAQGVYMINNKKIVGHIATNNAPIYKMYERDSKLWLISDEMLLRYDLDNSKIQYFTSADGLPKAEFKDIISIDGRAYIASSSGLLCFSSSALFINNTPPLLKLNSITVNDSVITYKDRIQLSSDKNDIGILFSVLSYKGENSIKVQYKINNGAWMNTESNVRKISLPSLSPGNYKVLIRAINEDGVQSEKDLSFYFSIKAPFYRQIWFLLGLGAISSIAIYIYFRTRLQREKKQNELMAQKVELEKALQQSMLTSIKSQMNPHFLFNALNIIQSYIYTNDKELASEYLGKFSELTRLILDMSNQPTVSLATEIRALKLYLSLEQQRFEDKLNCRFVIDKNLNAETIQIPSMIIQPYIENAIKHGLLHSKNPWQLSIHCIKTDTGIAVHIEDNGIGRKRSEELNKLPSRKYQSFSSLANQKRLSILNEGLSIAMYVEIIDKEDESGNATGTLVKLNIPFLKE